MIFVAGPHAVGKTFFAKYLEQQGFGYIDLGPTLRNIWQQTSPNIPFLEFIKFGEVQSGPHFTDNILVEAINVKLIELHEEDKDLLIIGSRSACGIEYLKEHISVNNGASRVVIYIDAPETVLYKRYCTRERKDVSLDDFRAIIEKDKAMGLEEIKGIADFFLVNDGEASHFEKTIEALIFGEMAYTRRSREKI